MSPSDQRRERYIRHLIEALPGRMSAAVHWLRAPSGRWVRLPVAALFILGGLLWFLPVLGLWMLPLGLLLLADDVPPLKRWVVRLIRRSRAKVTNNRNNVRG